MDAELYRAARSGDISVLREKERTLVLVVGDQLTPDKNSVLHLASQSGKIEFVQEILLMHPSLLCNTNSRGETALYLAAREGHSHVVKALIDEEKRQQEVLPHEKDLENGVESLSVKAMLRMADEKGNTALHEAVRYNHLRVVEVLLEEDRVENSLHTPNKDDETPLYMAAYRGHLDLVKAICENCISPRYSGPYGRTALHSAIFNSKKGCVEYLLGWKKTMIKEADIHGCTGFHYAAFDSLLSVEILEDLLKVDKSVAYQAENFGNKTPLHIAAIRDNLTAMAKLIASCPDSCCMIDKRGKNVLHFAVEFCDGTSTIQFILENYPAISSLLIQRDIDGNTPLHLLKKRDYDVRKIMRKYDMEDKEEFNNHHHLTLVNELHKDGGNTIEQLIVEEELNDVGADRTQSFLNAIGDSEKSKIKSNEELEIVSRTSKTRDTKEEIERIKKAAETHTIVAALITTVTFAAGFTLPGGLNGNEGPNQGLAILVRKHAFKAFMVTDTIALLSSTASLLMYFAAAADPLDEIEELMKFYEPAAYLNIIAIGAMVLTFITGTYVVLAHSVGLAITVCLIGCSFFIFIFVVLKKLWIVVWFLFCFHIRSIKRRVEKSLDRAN